MALFLGDQEFVLDEKGRLSIPSRFRDELPEDKKLAILNGLDGCLFMFPASEIKQIAGRFRNSRFLSDEKARRFQRLLTRGGSVERLDAQGRVLLNQRQIEYAGLTKKDKVAVVGNFDRIEIWKPETYAKHVELGADDPSLEDMASDFFGQDLGEE